MPGDHAILSPSGASRWIACPPSARLELTFPDSAGEAASEGTLAHRLSEAILRYKTKKITRAAYSQELVEIQADRQYQKSMFEYCDQYATFILERYAEAQVHTPDALIFIEQRLDLSAYIEDGFGTGDNIIIADRILDITDLKYGKGVVVSAEDNSQLKVYALGALEKFGHLYDVETVRMTIYQPRVDNYSTYELSVTELTHWAETVLKPSAALAFSGGGNFNPGLHCGFCRARAVCKANADYNLELARHEFEVPVFLEDNDIAEILSRADMFTKWLTSVKAYALKYAVHEGKKWPGYKLVEGRSSRIISDLVAAEEALLKVTDAATIFSVPELLSVAALETAIGKKKVSEALATLILRPPGKLALVPVSDKRLEFNSLDAAKRDFEDYEEGDDN